MASKESTDKTYASNALGKKRNAKAIAKTRQPCSYCGSTRKGPIALYAEQAQNPICINCVDNIQQQSFPETGWPCSDSLKTPSDMLARFCYLPEGHDQACHYVTVNKLQHFWKDRMPK